MMNWMMLLACAAAQDVPQEPTGGNLWNPSGGDVRLHEGHVSQTRLQMRDLGIAPYDVIPAGQTAITSLVTGRDGKIYGGTTGEVANLFVFSPEHNIVFPLGTIPGQESVHHALAVSREGLVYVGTSRNVKRRYLPDDRIAKGTDWYFDSVALQVRRDFDADPGGHLYVYDPASTRISFLQSDFRIGKPATVKDLGIPVPHEGIYSLLMDPEAGVLYGTTFPGGYLFRYECASGKSAVLGKLAPPAPKGQSLPPLCGALLRGPDGAVYASGERGHLVRYLPSENRLAVLPTRLPGLAGREIYNALEAGASHPDGRLYGGTTDGYLFRYDPATGEMSNLGRPLMESKIRALTVGRDGRLFGLGGEESGIGRLFTYDPRKGCFEDLGMLEVSMVPYWEWKGFVFDSMTIGPEGVLFIGNSEHRSRLFIYAP